MYRPALFVFILCWMWSLQGHGQVADSGLGQSSGCDSILVEHIAFGGNRQTREHIIRRELDFIQGQRLALADTAGRLGQSRNRVFNTRLFVTVSISTLPLAPPGTCPMPVVVEVVVRERWYIFPIPILELADRSINEWIYNQGARLNRINVGGRLEVANVRGRNESLKVIAQTGFTRKLEVGYAIPYLSGRRLREGLTVSGTYLSNRQQVVRSVGNRQDFISAPLGQKLLERYRASAELSVRPGFYTVHRVGLGFAYSHAQDSLVAANPDYFGAGRRSQRFFSLRYGLVHDRRDIRQYPLQGYYISAGLERLGLLVTDQVRIWSATAEAAIYRPLGGRFYLAAGVEGTLSTPGRQPYSVIRVLGFGQYFVRGYERFVIEGASNLVVKNTVRYRLLSIVREVPSMPIRQFRTLPLALYLKVFADGGYVRNLYAPPENARLMNTPLGGLGAGVDLVTYYDYVLRLEYTRNLQGTGGLFIHAAVEL